MLGNRAISRIGPRTDEAGFLELGQDAIFRLIYHSHLTLPDASQSPEASRRIKKDIAEQSARRNRTEGISGVLIERHGQFLQLIEGPAPSLERVFERICRDHRHHRLTLYDYAEIEEPVFPDWSMRYLAAESVSPPHREAVEDIFLEACATATGEDIVPRIDALMARIDPDEKTVEDSPLQPDPGGPHFPARGVE